jgi:hypothetical protein
MGPHIEDVVQSQAATFEWIGPLPLGFDFQLGAERRVLDYLGFE